jgi:hypothetical protein
MKINSLNKGLIGRWQFDAARGVKDMTPNARNGTRYGSITIGGAADRKAIASQATTFASASSQYVRVDMAKATFGSIFSICFWINPTAGAVNNGVGIMQCASVVSSGNPWILARSFSSVNYISWYLNGGYRINQPITYGGWNHIVLTYNGIVWTTYTNGSVSGTPYTAGIGSLDSNYVYFGNGYNGYYDGVMQDARIYNRVLSTTEITLLANSYKPVAKIGDLQKGLIGHWKLDAVNGAKDLTPYAHDGAGQGGVTIGGTTDYKGKANSATTMITNDYVSFGTYRNASSYSTASCWLRLNSSSQDSCIFGNMRGGSWIGYGKGLAYTNGLLRMVGEANNDHETLDYSYTDTTNWHNIACVWDSENSKLYIDGLEVATGHLLNAGWNYLFSIGAAVEFGVGKHFNGDIANVRLWNRILTPAEILLLAKSYI